MVPDLSTATLKHRKILSEFWEKMIFQVWTSEIIYGSSFKMSQKFYDPRNLSQESTRGCAY